ncbi:MAG: 50S ribosomal protein L18 [Candidatus Kariarchaeaceae archaeon]|jgi:large subunit ribosomal protein L18
MARGPIYRVKLRRRRSGKTDYYQRRELLKSGGIRLVIRRSTKHMRVHFVEAQPNGDITLTAGSSTELPQFNWNLSGGNIPAAYLTGYLTGKRAIKQGIEEAILDIGLQRNTHGSRIYAALKGVIDAGILVPTNDKIFPTEDVIKGSHIKTISEYLKKEDSKVFKKKFARYDKAKVKPNDIGKLVDKTKTAIDGEK